MGIGMKTSAMQSYPRIEDVQKVEQQTYRLLEDIGLPFKTVLRFEWMNEKGTAVWTGETEEAGTIKIYRGCDPEVVAHELGHGFHEALYHNRKVELPYPFQYPKDGEAIGEAIRFFVEQRRGSSWRPTRDKQTLEHCGYDFGKFRAMVRVLAQEIEQE